MFNPIALFAAAAVIIPVLIHLWNVRKGKTLKVGSIALLTGSAKKPATSLKITNWPLLLLRCLLLVFLALLLAKPFWQNDSGKKGGWIMIPGSQLAYAYQQYRPMIDSLLNEGFELHDLNQYRTPLSLNDTDQYQASSPKANSMNWPYLKYLDATLPPKFSIYTFSDDLLQNFSGDRPSIQLDLHCISLRSNKKADSTNVATYIDRDGNLMTMTAVSNATGGYYLEGSRNDLPAVDMIDTTDTIRIGLFAGNNTTDAKYLEAAITAVAEYSGRNIVTDRSFADRSYQTIFWLQDAAPEKTLINSLVPGGILFCYEDPASSVRINSPVNKELHALAGDEPDNFYQYTSGSLKGASVWTLSDGRPLLCIQSAGDKKIIYFKSRFNPQWTDMIWKEGFAQFLLPLILPAPPKTYIDLRKIDPQQAQPRLVSGKTNGNTDESGLLNRSDLSFTFWIIAFLLFLAERILAHHQNRRKDA